MKILIVSPEVSPYAKVGGLADAASSLPRALKRLGHDARVIMPCYKEIDDNGFTLRKGRKSVEVAIDGVLQKGLLRQTMLEGVPVYFIENRDYFYREGLYGNGSGDYSDNAQRFGFFCHAVLQLLRRMDFRPDVLHLHDWATGLIPVLLRTKLKDDPFYGRMSTVFTIHDFGDSGTFPASILETLGIERTLFARDELAHQEQISFLKGGLAFSDLITTVSENYRDEILSNGAGGGVRQILRQREKCFYGIMNGIDPKQWDPSLDIALPRPFNSQNLNGKKGNKRALQRELGLDPEPLIPLLGMVTRFTRDKGTDLMIDAWERLLARDMQLVIMGKGEERFERFFRDAAARYPGRVAIILREDAGLARRVFAGSDLFLVPSRHEPCGLEQIVALRYGSLPIVHKTGGLADTVIDSDEQPRKGNGFVFASATPEDMIGALDRALLAYENRRQWLKLVKRGMTHDFGWNSSVVSYTEIYRKAMDQQFVL